MESSLRVCDLEAALARMSGDVELLKKIAAYFREDSPEIMARLRQAVRACVPSAVEHEAHSLKGLIAHFHAEAATEFAIRLEHMGSMGDLTHTADALRELEHELSRLELRLADELSKL